MNTEILSQEDAPVKKFKTDPKRLEINRKWREQNRDIMRKHQRAYAERNKEELARRKRERIENDPVYAEAHRVRTALWYRNKLKLLRSEILSLLGTSCLLCGYADVRALCIDHLNGGGTQERKSASNRVQYFKSLLVKVKEKPSEYQVLCANCHTIKHSAEEETE